jgi:CBS-domain-containing membrane protein
MVGLPSVGTRPFCPNANPIVECRKVCGRDRLDQEPHRSREHAKQVAQGHDYKAMPIPIDQAGLPGKHFIAGLQDQDRQCHKANPSDRAPVTEQAESIKNQQTA